MIEAVLWDVDDTLFDFTGSERTGLLRHFEAEDLPADQDALDRWHLIAESELRRLAAGELTYEQQRRTRVRRFVGRPLSDTEANAWYDRYEALFEASWTAFPTYRRPWTRFLTARGSCPTRVPSTRSAEWRHWVYATISRYSSAPTASAARNRVPRLS
nr:hypothetical protein [Actinomadura sp. WMMA1423]